MLAKKAKTALPTVFFLTGQLVLIDALHLHLWREEVRSVGLLSSRCR